MFLNEVGWICISVFVAVFGSVFVFVDEGGREGGKEGNFFRHLCFVLRLKHKN